MVRSLENYQENVINKFFIIEMNMSGFCLDNTDPVLAAFFGLIISGLACLNRRLD